MAKTELFEGKSARLLCGLGAFPVKRGEADPDALETARLHLDKGRVLALFPEARATATRSSCARRARARAG